MKTLNFVFSHEISRQDHELMRIFKLLAISQHTQKSCKKSLAALSGKFFCVGLNLFHGLMVALKSTASDIKCHGSKKIYISLSLLIWYWAGIDLWKKLCVRSTIYFYMRYCRKCMRNAVGLTHFRKKYGFHVLHIYTALFSPPSPPPD